jgi:hypothetical protein
VVTPANFLAWLSSRFASLFTSNGMQIGTLHLTANDLMNYFDEFDTAARHVV